MWGQAVSPYGERLKHDPNFRGPVRHRSCTDIICLVIFTVFLGGYILLGILAWLYGDPRQVVSGWNSATGENRQVLQALGAQSVLMNILEDLKESWHLILFALLTGLTISLTFVLLLACVAKFLVWSLVVGVLAAMAYGICHCYMEYDKLDQEGATTTNVVFTTVVGYITVKEMWLVALIILCVVEVVMMLTVVALRKRIMLAIALIEEASRAIDSMESTIYYPLVTFSLLVVGVAYSGATALCLATIGEPLYRIVPKTDNSSDCIGISGKESCSPMTFNASTYSPCLVDCIFYKYNDEGPFQRYIFYLQIYNFVGLLWWSNFVIALGQCVLAGTFASYYWALRKPEDIPTCSLCISFVRTLRFHIGSLAFGSLVLAIVQLIRTVLQYLGHSSKDSSNKASGCLLCCLKCYFRCLETFTKFLNRNAYIMIAIYGENFCVSAKRAFSLLMRHASSVVVLDKVTDLLLFFGKLLVVGGVGIPAFLLFTGRIVLDRPEFKCPVLNYYWLPILTIVVGAYFVAQGFFSVYSICVDTLFLCFLEDLERNDGSPMKPYYMSSSLMDILKKKNMNVEAK